MFAALASGGCSENPIGQLESDDYVVFGDFFGECIGEGCIEIFKIQDGRVFADTLDRYPSHLTLPHATAFVEIPDDSYDILARTFSEIPADLFKEERIVIGQPDAGDWGGNYLEVSIDGDIRYWIIDKMEDNLPSYLRDFAKKLDVAIEIAGR